MAESPRSEIMARLRAAAGASASATTPEQIARELAALGFASAAVLPAADTCIAFMANVLANKGSVELAADRAEAVRVVGRYLYNRFRTHKLVAGNDPRIAAMPWRDAGVLPRFGAAENGDGAALSYARLGVAETGAVVTWTGRANPGRNNLLPEDHLVLINREDVVATLEDAWLRIRQELPAGSWPRGINFIAGPSSTADVEAQLVMGAHGPRRWHVILVGATPAEALAEAKVLTAATGP
ncbi:lactate utilization protein [Haliea sp. E1-2-M8]|uniref:LutC/YkgG family protein n=1 Tax=Haliea sp. E1-2-M8 TaxID=3064706 RepID=UPI002723ADE4|nr:lactate utilization protein [Haliea sp. E1-2-M8]MDO8861268.1 lactate utilization protein [Haliea sp. E1-2-M8]